MAGSGPNTSVIKYIRCMSSYRVEHIHWTVSIYIFVIRIGRTAIPAYATKWRVTKSTGGATFVPAIGHICYNPFISLIDWFFNSKTESILKLWLSDDDSIFMTHHWLNHAFAKTFTLWHASQSRTSKNKFKLVFTKNARWVLRLTGSSLKWTVMFRHF